MKKWPFFIGGVFAFVLALVVFTIWTSRLRDYDLSELSSLRISKEGAAFRIQFKVQQESYYFPVLIDYRREGNQIFVTIKKCLKISPSKGIMYTPPPSQVLLDFMNPKIEVDERVYTFGLENPNFVLSTPSGITPIEVQ